jgi:hypothetical protein
MLLCLAQLKYVNVNVNATLFCSDSNCITTNMKIVLLIMKNAERRYYRFWNAQVRDKTTTVPVDAHYNFFYSQNIFVYSLLQTNAVFWKLPVIFWVDPRRVVFKSRRFETLCLFDLYRPMKMEQCVPKRRLLNSLRRGINPKDNT